MTQARNLARLLNKQMTTYKYTASAAQTSFVDSDDAGLVLSYTPNNLIVTYNGVVLENGSEYTATNGTNVVLADAADAAAEVNIMAFQSASLGGYLEITGGTIGGNLGVTGNVGIGTESPGTRLQVAGTQNVPSGTSKGMLLVRADGSTHGLQMGVNSSAPWGSWIQAQDNNISSPYPLTLQPGGGNVGIGTSTPDGALHVHTGTAGTVSASVQADELVLEGSAETGMTIISPDDQSARIRFTSPSTNTDVGGASILYRQNINKMLIGTEVAGGVLALKSGAGTEAITIDSAGRVTMPYQPAMFAQPDSSTTVAVGTGIGKYGWNTSGGKRFNRGFIISGASGGSLYFNAGNTGRITVPSAGIYQLYFDMRCESPSSSGQAGVFINGTQYIRRHIEEWATIAYNHFIIQATLNLAASDYIELGAWWNGTPGGALSGISDTVNWMSLQKIA